MEKRTFTRRDFLRLTGMGAASVLAVACTAPPIPAGGEQVSAPPAVSKARQMLRLQSSFPVDYPNTLVMSQNVFPEFKETHPDFEVEVNFVPVPDVARSFVQALEVDQAPDFFYAFESQGTLAYLGHLYDLTDVVQEAGLRDDFYQSAKDLWTFGGKLVGIPMYFGTKCYIYRVDFFEEAGLDADQFPATWEEFQEAAIKLMKTDSSGKIMRDGFNHAQDFEHLVSHIHQNGGSEYSGDEAVGPAAINSPEALEAFTWWCDLVRKYGVQAKEGSPAPEDVFPIVEGYTAIDMVGPWWVPNFRQSRPEIFEQDLIRVAPPLTRKAQVGHLDAEGWSVNAHSNILEEVLDFVRIFLKDEHYMHYHDSKSADGQIIFQNPTSRRSINEHPKFWIANEPVVRDTAFRAAFDTGKSTARKHLGYIEAREFVYPRMVEQGIYQIKSDQAILDAAARQMDEITERTKKELG
jgi:multiple sugar transport system substrate-binding protein